MVAGVRTLGLVVAVTTALSPAAALGKQPYLPARAPMLQDVAIVMSASKKNEYNLGSLHQTSRVFRNRGRRTTPSSSTASVDGGPSAWDGFQRYADRHSRAQDRAGPLSRARSFVSSLEVPTKDAIAKDMMLAAVLGLLADLFTQFVCEGANILSLDMRRVAAMTAFSGLYMGGFCHFVFATYAPFSVAATNLLRRVRDKALGKVSSPSVVKPSPFAEGALSSLAENLLHVPLLYIPAFFMLVEGPFKGGTLAFAELCAGPRKTTGQGRGGRQLCVDHYPGLPRPRTVMVPSVGKVSGAVGHAGHDRAHTPMGMEQWLAAPLARLDQGRGHSFCLTSPPRLSCQCIVHCPCSPACCASKPDGSVALGRAALYSSRGSGCVSVEIRGVGVLR
mmetsp:Transcript_4635/g.9967  ORF Transcript_4635/g.9967 Transcript_4635/m.9967 type:complete len:391 (+) Transcript_4635:92-1264(+)